MGLFGNRDITALREILDGMHGSTLRDIDDIRAGNPPADRDFDPEMQLNNRISRAAALVAKLAHKGKQAEAQSVLSEFEAKPVPQLLFFRATEVGGFESAAAAAAEEMKSMGPDPEQEEKDRQWRDVIDEIRSRSGLTARGAAS